MYCTFWLLIFASCSSRFVFCSDHLACLMEFNPGVQAQNTSCTAYSGKEQEGEKSLP